MTTRIGGGRGLSFVTSGHEAGEKKGEGEESEGLP